MVDQVEIVADDGRRIGVRVAPYRSRTHLVILDLDDPPWFLTRATLPPIADPWVHAVAALAVDDPDYHWDTPRYRDLCLERGLDPDRGRPRFAERYRAAADELLLAVNRTEDAPSPAAANVLLDLVDLLRIDGGGHAVSAEGLRAAFARQAHADRRVADEVLAVLMRIPGLRQDLLPGTDPA